MGHPALGIDADIRLHLSLLKSGKVKGVRFETLAPIRDGLDCQPGNLREFLPEGEG
jgi:putative transcriptional regulator